MGMLVNQGNATKWVASLVKISEVNFEALPQLTIQVAHFKLKGNKKKTSELKSNLDQQVFLAAGPQYWFLPGHRLAWDHREVLDPASDWAQGGMVSHYGFWEEKACTDR